MYFRDNRRHHAAHIHVRYQGSEAVVSIEDGSVFDGTIPAKQLKMIQAWVEIHKEELMVDWELAVNGEQPFRIAPLQ
jgi:hypothetical protein